MMIHEYDIMKTFYEHEALANQSSSNCEKTDVRIRDSADQINNLLEEVDELRIENARLQKQLKIANATIKDSQRVFKSRKKTKTNKAIADMCVLDDLLYQ